MRGRIAMLFVALLAAAPLVMAQSRVTAEIPFAVTVHDREYSAGEWEILRLPAHTFTVRAISSDLRESFVLVMNSFEERTGRNGQWPAKLVFNRYGDKYFLSEIHFGQQHYGYAVPGKQEKALRVAGVKPARTWIFARLKK